MEIPKLFMRLFVAMNQNKPTTKNSDGKSTKHSANPF